MRLFRIFLLSLFLIFLASSAAAVNNSNIILLEWKCTFCSWQWYGDNPPRSQKCYGNKQKCHNWVLENIFIFPEKDNKPQLSSLTHSL